MLNTRYKTQLCNYHEKDGVCPMGQKCHFAHGKSELRIGGAPLPKNTPLLPQSKLNQAGLANMFPNTSMINNYKTQPCKYFEEGKCKYAKNCSFAHGNVEMRTQCENSIAFNTQNMNAQQSMDPMKDIMIDILIKMQQLYMISTQLEKLHPEDGHLMIYVANANSFLEQGQVNQAGELLQRVIYSPNLQDDIKKMHEQVVSDAQKFAEKCYNSIREGHMPSFIRGAVPSLANTKPPMQQQQIQA